MQDLAGAILVSIALSVLVVFVISALVAEHTSAKLPRILRNDAPAVGRRSLLVELPWAVFIIGGGEIAIVLFLVHPDSTLPVRLVSAVQLAGAAGWIVFLARLISRSKSGRD